MATYQVQYTQLPLTAVKGMADAYSATSDLWKSVVYFCICEAAKKHSEVTVDEVLHELAIENKRRGSSLSGGDAIGPMMQRAAKDGVLTGTNQARRSKRDSAHGRLITVWKSNLYQVSA